MPVLYPLKEGDRSSTKKNFHQAIEINWQKNIHHHSDIQLWSLISDVSTVEVENTPSNRDRKVLK